MTDVAVVLPTVDDGERADKKEKKDKKDKKDKKEKKEKKDKKDDVPLPLPFGGVLAPHLPKSSAPAALSSPKPNALMRPPQLRTGRGNVATEDLEGMGFRRKAAGTAAASIPAAAPSAAVTSASALPDATATPSAAVATGQVKRPFDATDSASVSADTDADADIGPASKAPRVA
jgi:hypothetical protein